MRRLSALIRLVTATVMFGAIFVAGDASSQSSKSKKAAAPSTSEVEAKVSVFSGNELRLGPFWFVEADCSSRLIDVRIAHKPANGEVVFKEAKTVVEVKKDTIRARCNGTPINAIAAFYTSREGFTGQERIAIDIDAKNGLIRRYNYIVSVR